MDFLRCKGNFATKQKIFEAIDAMKKDPNIKIVRIKNRIKVIGDVMVNFWYKERMLGECQLYLQTFEGMSQEKIKQITVEADFNHFAYELSRNPIGVVCHCIELLVKAGKKFK